MEVNRLGYEPSVDVRSATRSIDVVTCDDAWS